MLHSESLYFLPKKQNKEKKPQLKKDLFFNLSTTFRSVRSITSSSLLKSPKNKLVTFNSPQSPQSRMIYDRINNYNSTTQLTKLHDQIVSSLKCMPEEIMNSINIMQFVHCVWNGQNIDIEEYRQQAEFYLMQAAQDIENDIIIRMMKPDFNDVHKHYSSQYLISCLSIISGSVFKLLKWLHSLNHKLGSSIENIWKALIFLIDLNIQWSNDNQNKFIQEQVQIKLDKLNRIIEDCRQQEEKLKKKLIQKEQALNDLSNKYINLQQQFELSNDYYGQKLKEQENDLRYMAEGGIQHMNRSVQQLGNGLKNLNNSTKQNRINFQNSMKTVASSVLSLKQENQYSLQRKIIGIDQIKQAPGDIAFGHLISEHPWISYLKLQSFTTESDNDTKNLTLLEKQDLFHELLTQPISLGCSPTNQLIQMFNLQGLGYTIKTIKRIIEEEYETSDFDLIFPKIFNLKKVEGLQQYHFNNIKRFYQVLINKFVQPKLLKEKYHILNTQIETFALHSLKDIIIKYYSEDSEQIWRELQLDDVESISIIKVLQRLIESIYKINQDQYIKRLNEITNMIKLIQSKEDLFKLSVVQIICERLFSEYDNLDKNKILSYMTWRYFITYDKGIVVKKEQVKGPPKLQEQMKEKEDMPRKSEVKEKEDMPRKSEVKEKEDKSRKSEVNEKEDMTRKSENQEVNQYIQFMLDTLQRIKSLLIFNSDAFDRYRFEDQQEIMLESNRSIEFKKRKFSIVTPLVDLRSRRGI